MKAPKSYLTTAFSAPLRAQKARIANLFAQNRRSGGTALALLCVLVVSVGTLVSCQVDSPAPPTVPTASPAPAPSDRPIAVLPLSDDSSFVSNGLVFSLGEPPVPFWSEERDLHMISENYARVLNRSWYGLGDNSTCTAAYAVDRLDGTLRLHRLQWSTPELATARGARVGDRLDDALALYPEAEEQSSLRYLCPLENCELVICHYNDVVTDLILTTDRYPAWVRPSFPEGSQYLPAEQFTPEQYQTELDPGNVAGALTAIDFDNAPDYPNPEHPDLLSRVAAGPDGWELYYEGTLFILRHGADYRWFRLPWTPRTIPPELWLDDFDGDGKDELAIHINSGSGTGFSVWDLFLLDPEETPWTLTSPLVDLPVDAALSADGKELLLHADYATLSVPLAEIPGLPAELPELALRMNNFCSYQRDGDRITLSVPLMLAEAPSPLDLAEAATLTADLVYLPEMGSYTFINLRLSPVKR